MAKNRRWRRIIYARPSFLEGMARVMDIGGTLNEYDIPGSEDLRAARAPKINVPPPEDLRRYEEILPGSAERILTMAENQHRHLMSQENSALGLDKFSLETAKSKLAKDAARSTWGMALAFIVGMTGLGSSTYLLAIDRWEAGLPLGLATIASLAGAFIYGVKTRRNERRRELESEEE